MLKASCLPIAILLAAHPLAMADEIRYGYDCAGTLAARCSQLESIYHRVLGRDPDAGGFAYWMDLAKTGESMERIEGFIATSPEAQRRLQANQGQGWGIADPRWYPRRVTPNPGDDARVPDEPRTGGMNIGIGYDFQNQTTQGQGWGMAEPRLYPRRVTPNPGDDARLASENTTQGQGWGIADPSPVRPRAPNGGIYATPWASSNAKGIKATPASATPVSDPARASEAYQPLPEPGGF